MPWPKRTTRGSCLFCRQEFTIVQFAQGDSWCRCPGADRHRKAIKNSRNRFYYLQAQKEKGLAVAPNRPRGDKSGFKQPTSKGKSSYRRAKNCGHWSLNYWNCPACAARLESAYDLSFLVSDADTRHNGVRI
jgi:hypothetical protein